MKTRTHFHVSRKNPLTWLMALCLVGSAVTRIVLACLKGSGEDINVWSQIVLPAAAALLYVLIVLLDGKERFYKTAIPVFLAGLFYVLEPVSLFTANALVAWMYSICVLFMCLMYTAITCGKLRYAWLLLPLYAIPMGVLGYQMLTPANRLSCLPDLLFFAGLLVLVFAIRLSPQGEYHPTWGDRPDGRRIRSMDPMNQVIPYIMVEKSGATNYFTEAFEITSVERFIRQKRRDDMPNLGLTHILLACYVRALCRYPGLNRFVAGQKVYSRMNDVQFCLTVKKEMSAEAAETVIKVHLSPSDTLADVYRKLNEKVEEVKNTPLDSSFDNTAHAFTMIPGVFLKFAIWLLKLLDYFGLMPRFIMEVSPFHGSLFMTSMGSLGIPPIYHHLYDFGNLPVFGSFGCKRRAIEVLEDGTVVQRKYMDCKFTMDERIADGFYYAAFFKHYKRLLAHPEVLLNAPDEILPDIE